MQRFMRVLPALVLIAIVAGHAAAQSDGLTTLLVETGSTAQPCSEGNVTIMTLDLAKWSAYTFFWVGTQISPDQLSLTFCDNAGRALVAEGANAAITRAGLELVAEADGFWALDDIPGVSVRLSSSGELAPGAYTLRHWTFERSLEQRTYPFTDDHRPVVACGNDTGNWNAVRVWLSAGFAHDFIGNEHEPLLAVCEKVGQSYINPTTPPDTLLEADAEVYVFRIWPPDGSAPTPADLGPAFTVTAYTPGEINYPWDLETQASFDKIDHDQRFATLGSLASLFRVIQEDGSLAVDVYGAGARYTAERMLRVSQADIDAQASGLVAATEDDRLIVKRSSRNIVTFSMGPDADGMVHHLEMDEGLAGPVSGTSATADGPPGEAYTTLGP